MTPTGRSPFRTGANFLRSAMITLSKRSDGAAGQRIGQMMRSVLEYPEVLSLAAGYVDRATLPLKLVEGVAAEILAGEQSGLDALQYGDPSGNRVLRELVASHLNRLEEKSGSRGRASAGDLLMTSGSNQFLSLTFETLLDPGDICLVASPTYFVVTGMLRGVLARPYGVETDGQGMTPEGLDAALTTIEAAGDLPKVKLVYIVSYHDNPAGANPSRERREAVLQTVERWREKQPMLVCEDAAYRELTYDGEEQPSLWRLDASGETVIYSQTFSKSFSPGVRVGFGTAPPAILKAMLDRKANEDFGSPHLSQCVMARVFETGLYERHVDALRSSYRIKRDAALAAIDEHFADLVGVAWSRPTGGLYVWVTLPESVSTDFDSPLWKAAVERQQVMYVPGEVAFAAEPARQHHHMRLSFGVLTPDQINEGVRRLAEAIRTVTAD